jgi:hypothetical protein
VLHQDWQQAYASLDASSRRRWGAEPFARLARQYRRGLGFEPDAVRVRSCEEHGDEAVAHVLLTGRAASGARHYRDALTLKRDSDGWRVVLPPRFGETGGR